MTDNKEGNLNLFLVVQACHERGMKLMFATNEMANCGLPAGASSGVGVLLCFSLAVVFIQTA